jgi:hypothetical protein
MAITELEINGQSIQLVKKVSELENDAEFQTKEEVQELINQAIGEIENGTY